MSVRKKIVLVKDAEGGKFCLFTGSILVSRACFRIENPDQLFNGKYVGLFGLFTVETHRRQGFMKFLLGKICFYVKALGIENVLLNVFQDNVAAVSLYLGLGFEVHKIGNDNGKKYYTLLKRV